MDPQKKIRVGILINRASTSAWSYEVLKEISESDYAELVLVIYNGDERKKQPKRLTINKFFSRFNYLLSYLYDRLDSRLFKAKQDAFKTFDLKELLSGIHSITVVPDAKGLSQWFPRKDIEEIKKHNPDVLIRLGFSILKGEILTTARYGTWSLHHGDNKVNRGGPPGFWEIYFNQPVTGSILQVLTEDLDNGTVLYKSYAATHKYSVALNKNALYWKSGKFFTRKLKELYHDGFESLRTQFYRDINFYDRPLYTRATNLQMLNFFFRLFGKMLSKGIQNLFKRNQWFLLYAFNRTGEVTQSMRKFKKLYPQSDRFWADPCLVFKDNKYYIFIEEKLDSHKDAHISVIEMDEKGNYQQPKKVLDTGYHLSYPFVFEYEGSWYMMPETKSKNSIEVYKCAGFPHQWEFHKTILSDVKAVDPTLFNHNNKWWLFTGIADGNSISRNDELFIFHSTSPFGPWIPHEKNPVVSDVRRARPAGKIIRYKNKIYRPSQDCSVTYGYGFRMNEIITLNEQAYEEQEIDFIEPNWNKNMRGTHTFCFEHNLTVVDGFRKKWKF
ncbi:MAG: hypothetical protein ABI763_11530 [Bacteroidota bacterium]